MLSQKHRHTLCCKGERRQWRIQRTEAGAAVAECEGLLLPKHDAGTATRHWRAFWERRCRAAAAGTVLKPSGGNCAVLPKSKTRGIPGRKPRVFYNIAMLLCLPQAVQVAVGVYALHRFALAQHKAGLGGLAGLQEFAVNAVCGFHSDPFNVVHLHHRMLH